ncbi:MAG: hypothetical protein ABSD49_04485 [Candidatus Bathyarchaeia archaeon]
MANVLLQTGLKGGRIIMKHIIITKSTEGMKIALEPVEFPYFQPEVS